MADINNTKPEIKESEVKTGSVPHFDPQKKAELVLAEKHRQARQVRKVSEAMKKPNIEKCECCGFPVYADPFSINCDLVELSELGTGFPLFFLFIKVMGIVLIAGIFFPAIPCLIGNNLADNGDE